MRIGGKVTTAFAVLSLLTAVAGYFGMKVSSTVEHEFNRIAKDSLPDMTVLEDVRMSGAQLAFSTLSDVVKSEGEGSREPIRQFRDALYRYRQQKKNNGADAERLAKKMEEAGGKFQGSCERLFAMAGKGAPAATLAPLKQQFEADRREFEKAAGLALAMERAALGQNGTMAGKAINTARQSIRLVTILMFVMALACSAYISGYILLRIARIRQAAERIGEGDLDVAITVTTRDELGALAETFNRMAADLKQSREEVVSARNYLDNIIHSMIDSLIVVGPDGLIQNVNAATCSMLGYEEEPVGQPYSRILTDPPFGQLIEKGIIRDTEKTYITGKGTEIPVAFSGSVMWNEDGTLQGFVCTAFDITELKKAEEELRNSQKFFRSVLDSMNDAVSIIDAGTLAIVGVNKAFLSSHQLRIEEAIGRRCYDISNGCADICNELDEACPIRRTLTMEKSSAAEHLCYDLEGQRQFVEVSASPIRDREGNIVRIVQVSRDITERKRAEEELQRYSEELRKSNDDLRDFAYIVSHDLRAPLVNIKGFSSELNTIMQELDGRMEQVLPLVEEREREAILKLLRHEVPEALDFINSSVMRMNSLIKGILKLSRMGLQKLMPGRVRTGELVSGILKSMAHQLEQGQVTVNVGDLPHITADRTAVEQIFGNLIDNAVRYLDPARTGQLQIEADLLPGEVIFHVRDNGRGIEREDLGKVFEIFRRAGDQDVPGEGLGLAFVKTLVRRTGGRIWCESTPGIGTTFSFTVPSVDGASEEKSVKQPASGELSYEE